jgi:hypothetical protein
LNSFVKELGFGLAVAALVALALERLVHEALLTQVESAVAVLREKSDVLKGATELGIEDITARRVQCTRDHWEQRIRDAMRTQLATREGEILITCVAAPDFFRQGNEIGQMLWDALTDTRDECKTHLRVLLLSPESQWANIRQELEPLHQTIPDIHAAITFLLALKENSRSNVEICCGDMPPLCFLVITDASLFLEPYPLAQLKPGQSPIGGKTPLLVFGARSQAYAIWKKHFEYVWTHHSKPLSQQRPSD